MPTLSRRISVANMRRPTYGARQAWKSSHRDSGHAFKVHPLGLGFRGVGGVNDVRSAMSNVFGFFTSYILGCSCRWFKFFLRAGSVAALSLSGCGAVCLVYILLLRFYT